MTSFEHRTMQIYLYTLRLLFGGINLIQYILWLGWETESSKQVKKECKANGGWDGCSDEMTREEQEPEPGIGMGQSELAFQV